MPFSSPTSRVFSATEQNIIARDLRSLHKAGNPVFFTNVYDAITASIAASHASVPAIATASFAVAATLGLADEELSYDDNFSRVPVIMKAIKDVAMKSGQPMKPLSVDMQDGYTDVRKTVTDVIMLGAVGGNIEDTSSQTGKLVDVDEAAARVAQAAATAKELGVPDFVINARCDALIHGHDLDEAVKRGKKYLEAGATCVYVWGGSKRGLATDEVKTLVHELNGMINVKMNLKPGFLGPKELKEIGVCRVSVGPELFHLAMAGFKSGLDQIYPQ